MHKATRIVSEIKNVLVTGGGGYVGSLLVPALLEAGYRVKALDTFWYGRHFFSSHPNLQLVELDIRETQQVQAELAGQDAVIHLACISNDPSYDLNPTLGKSINYDSFEGLLEGAVRHRVQRFLYASSSSIYGVKAEPEVREEAQPEPLTDYSRYKLACERQLLEVANPEGMVRTILRPATLCGYAPRLRLDLTVNILTIHALANRRIRVFGGDQLRPNLHIADMVRAYLAFLVAPAAKIHGQAFNIGYQNRAVKDIAQIVHSTIGDEDIEVVFEPSDDQRSYHVNSDKVKAVLGFEPQHTIEDAVQNLVDAWHAKRIQQPFGPLHHNIKRMQELNVQ